MADSFSVKQYRWPFVSHHGPPDDDSTGVLAAPVFPAEDATESALIDFIRRSNQFVCDHLNEVGADLPEGTLAVLDPISGTLAIRGTDAVHKQLDFYMHDLQKELPKNLPWTLEVVEASASEVRNGLDQTHLMGDHAGLRTQLLKSGKSISYMQGEAKAGTPSVSESGSRESEPAKAHPDEESGTSLAAHPLLYGQRFQADAILGRNGLIDLNFSLHQRYSMALAQAEETPHYGIQTSIAMESGWTHLLGVSQPTLFRKPDKADIMHATFLRMTAVPVMADENPRVMLLLEQLGAKVVPIPKGILKVLADQPPKGMQIRRFKVGPDFLELGKYEDGTDPFAPGERVKAKIPKTTQQILEDMGVPFPKGSWARYVRITRELIVCNTQENLDLVVALFESLGPEQSNVLEFTLHILQGNAQLVREIATSCYGKPDHSRPLQKLKGLVVEGKASFLHSMWMEVKAGSRAKTRNSIRTMANPSVNKEGESSEIEIGTQLVVDAVVGADGQTIDVDFALNHDFALPTQMPPTATPELYRMSCKASMTMLSGSTRLISVWKPRGTPELEGDVMQAAFLTAHVVKVGGE